MIGRIARSLSILTMALGARAASADPSGSDVAASFGLGGAAEAPSLGVFRVLAALLATLAAVLLVAAILRRTPMGRRAAALGVEHRLSVARGGSVAVVHVEGRRLLLGITPSQINLITELDEPPAGAMASSSAMAGRPFDRLLTGLLRRGREEAK